MQAVQLLVPPAAVDTSGISLRFRMVMVVAAQAHVRAQGRACLQRAHLGGNRSQAAESHGRLSNSRRLGVITL